ncbi:MAG: SDR family NAD(P)-dependent oxidoreductase [Oscillatoria sp. PMC 1051.18]|nr:SDR family NAD(P)-dependent oxidoreductase [Oscillatoria sp. PMC 1050.18]MEC5033133.1 SDR family NAD(P)-dependent oxidoreductase [Oscillatoria sp. PMC 1051.18]
MIDFDNRVVLLTGAAQGLGLAYARTIAERGGTVLLQDIGADRDGKGEDLELVHRTSESLCADGLSATALTGRIETKEQCRSLITEAIDKAGRLDAIIHNAGWVAYQEIEVVTESDFDQMMNIAAKAGLWLTQAAWPHMKAAKFGRIVLTTSDRALYPQYVQDGLACYAAAKMAAIGLVNVLASEGQPHGIMVNAVSPVAKTRMWGVEGEPDELHPAAVASGVAYLVSEVCQANGWILRASNGQFHATRQVEAEDVDYPRNLRGINAATVEDVAANWSRIAVPTIEPRL